LAQQEGLENTPLTKDVSFYEKMTLCIRKTGICDYMS